MACFTRPEFKAERISYDLITPSAARGILEAVYWKPQIRWVVDALHVLNAVRFMPLVRNEVGVKAVAQAARAAMAQGEGNLGIAARDQRQRRSALVLCDVAYVIQAHFVTVCGDDNPGMHLDRFLRLVRRGRCHSRPYLGCREFDAHFALSDAAAPPPPHPSLVGERDLGWMLHDLDFAAGRRARFFRAVMRDGVVTVPPPQSPEVRG